MEILKDKVAVITGASSGIGAAIARQLNDNGAKIVLLARNEDKMNTVAEDFTDALIIPTDVTDRASVEQAIEHTIAHFGQVDFLINSAGLMTSSAITKGDVSGWDAMIDVNVKGTLYAINAVMPHLQSQSSGHIINISSISGFEVTKVSTLYSATKAAVHAITQGLEKELARTGIRSTSISPGMVDTPLNDGYDFGDRKMLEAQNIADAVLYALTQPAHVNVNEITVRPV
ncbi:SDR family NAD(P)-dependent oxidoreductase [Staphylococcus muscae]|uniref:Oxidoreductase n=1 Tax=Staphylococcus muscae TaxID=1294 RepID=A0A240C9N0_9STAP|nr:SDR family oxidoreductase [Staphylococcus muscae]AVQ33894.1 SDR family NAD(P)-dependent oxidoreductase [Staphylococcus muscae]PNZ04576.1 SDR family NAD(P)-dependent oxidoreductase [Staphylococcus muscae]GGA83462.1 putative oxidoreductase [Staphylococcus muscae]SNW04579.1 short chain dehydrogenase [Staphylococcus muscae]